MDVFTQEAPGEEYSLEQAFPEVDPEFVPSGPRVLVQIRTPAYRTKGGIIVPDASRDDDRYNTQVGKVIAIGPLAFHKRDTLTPWPEGAWCKVGDFIRIPKHGGDRWGVQIPGARRGEEALFLVIEDHQVIGIKTGDPLGSRTFW